MPLSAIEQQAISQPRELPLNRRDLALKRAVDITVAVVALVLCLPVIAILGLMIKLNDGGPILYRRRVLGRTGEFNAYKLRTMRVDADEVLRNDFVLRQAFEINFKLRKDPRVTPIGAILRRSSLDELPQLWNVIKGEMSLVGPRMISPVEGKKYGDAAWIFRCLKPGMTGYWQVNGTETPASGYDSRVAMDLFYAENWSLAMDLKIMMKTPARMVRGAGAK